MEKAIGMVTMKVKIFKIEKKVNLFVIDKDNFKYDFLIGLDMIRDFKLIQNENLEIIQKVSEIPSKNITKNYLEHNEEKTESKEKYKINFNENIKVTNFDISVKHLNYQQKNEINQLIKNYNAVFAKDKYDRHSKGLRSSNRFINR